MKHTNSGICHDTRQSCINKYLGLIQFRWSHRLKWLGDVNKAILLMLSMSLKLVKIGLAELCGESGLSFCLLMAVGLELTAGWVGGLGVSSD